MAVAPTTAPIIAVTAASMIPLSPLWYSVARLRGAGAGARRWSCSHREAVTGAGMSANWQAARSLFAVILEVCLDDMFIGKAGDPVTAVAVGGDTSASGVSR